MPNGDKSVQSLGQLLAAKNRSAAGHHTPIRRRPSETQVIANRSDPILRPLSKSSWSRGLDNKDQVETVMVRDRPSIGLPAFAKDLDTVQGAIKHLVSCIDVCSGPAYKESLYHWRWEVQRPQIMRAMHMFAVLEGCVRTLQEARRYSSIVELAKAMMLLDFDKQQSETKTNTFRKISRPKPLAALVRLCATRVQMEISQQSDGRGMRPMWGGQGQIMTLQVLACFLLHRLSLYATNEEKVEQPVFKNTLSLLVELCDVLSKPGLAIELEDCQAIVRSADILLTCWYERMWVTIPLHLVTDKINAIGVVGMLVRCLSNAQSTLVHEPTYAKLIAKQSVLEKQMLNRLKEDPEHHVGVYVGHRIRSSLRQSRSPKLRRKRHNNYLPSIRQNSHDSRRQHQPRNRVIDRVEHAPALMPQLGFNLALQQMETDDMLVLSSLPSRQKGNWMKGTADVRDGTEVTCRGDFQVESSASTVSKSDISGGLISEGHRNRVSLTPPPSADCNDCPADRLSSSDNHLNQCRQSDEAFVIHEGPFGVPGGVASSSVTGQEPTVSIVDDSRTGESSSQIAPRHPLAVLGEAVIVMPVHRQPFVSSGDDKPLDIVEVEPQPDRPHVSKACGNILHEVERYLDAGNQSPEPGTEHAAANMSVLRLSTRKVHDVDHGRQTPTGQAPPAGMVGKHKFTIYTPTEHMVRYTKQNTGSLVGTRASSFSSTRKIPVVNAREMTEVRGGVQHEDDSEFLGAWETAEAESPDTPLGLGMTKNQELSADRPLSNLLAPLQPHHTSHTQLRHPPGLETQLPKI